MNSVDISGECLSLLCSFLLLITWYILPGWRTLNHYITCNQIISGTLYLLFSNSSSFFKNTLESHSTLKKYYFYLRISSFILSICWSLCASLFAYLKLVLLHSKKISYEKRKATVLACVIFIIIFGNDYLKLSNSYNASAMLIFNIMIINLVIFKKIFLSVMSCCKTSMSRRNFKHLLSLLGVALICDSFTIYFMVSSMILKLTYYGSVIHQIMYFIFAHRLVFQSVFILVKSTTRTQWRQYIKKTKNRFFNNITLV
ncbi:hypothetical protein O3G_MSEX008627 [Manduca sexta]|uniref:Uncharacterized protein n=1 Tax=Manduca sexta TaxID=7130 RepID=A0A921ZAN9_MANSE|nr:hypothetical protein O3G_MSEX008627 [Manduca sexta]